MYVISFVNPKGGSGKTTSAMLLAEQIVRAGGKTAVLDLDPNANIVSWAEARKQAGKNVPFSVMGRPPVDETVETIERLSENHDYLVIDLEGSKDQIVTFALSRTDLCIIPLDGSPMEARQAAQAVKLVKMTANMIRHEIGYALLFTRTNAAFQSSDERDVRDAMAENDIEVLPVRLAKRSPYTRIFRENILLEEIYQETLAQKEKLTRSAYEKAEKQVVSAIQNATDYAKAVIKLIKEGGAQNGR